jgi:hypothetical protein
MVFKLDPYHENGCISFNSMSNNNYLKYLSNHTYAPGGITIQHDFPIKNMIGLVFPTIENAFQASKYAVLGNMSKIMEFTLISPTSAQNICRSLKTNQEWSKKSIEIMKSLIKGRCFTDFLFNGMIEEGQRNGHTFKCIQEVGVYSFWGGYFNGASSNDEWIGNNVIGKIMQGEDIFT